MVVTTFCRSCGEHLRMEKNRVEASSKINPVPSSVYPALPEAPEVNKYVPRGAGTEVELTDRTARSEHVEKNSSLINKATLAELAGSQVLAPPSTFAKMQEESSSRHHRFQKVECFDCHHTSKVGRAAKSTNCPVCGVYICLENFEINLNSTAPIRTRGDVLVRKNGNLSTKEIHCRNLVVQGIVSGNIDCTGEFLISTRAHHVGNVRCRRIVIDKGSDIHFLNTVVANDVEVRACVTGNIECHGPLLITATGRVHGDVSALSVSIQPGGQLDGAVNILRPSPTDQAPRTEAPPISSSGGPAPAVGRHD